MNKFGQPFPAGGRDRDRDRDRDRSRGGEPRARMNYEIRVPEIRVVDDQGAMLGIMSPREALKIAEEQEKDLIEIAPQANPPVCKIMSMGKFRYEQQKREKLQKKSQHQPQLKEIRFNPDTDTHDVEFKTRHAREFLLEGHKVKASVRFHGREIVHSKIGIALLEGVVQSLEDIAKIDQPIRMEGMNCTVMLMLDKTKVKTKAPKQ